MSLPSQIKKAQEIVDPLIKKKYVKYLQLPQDLRQIIFNTETAGKIGAATKKNRLDKDQLWQTSYITGMILDETSARQLARDINQTIFLPVKQSLKKVHQISEWPREDEPAKPTPPEPTVPTIPEPSEPRIEGNIVDLKQE